MSNHVTFVIFCCWRNMFPLLDSHLYFVFYLSGLRARIDIVHRRGDLGASLNCFWQQALVAKRRCGRFWISNLSAPSKVFAVLLTLLPRRFMCLCSLYVLFPWLFLSKHEPIAFVFLILGVHYPSLASLCSQKVVESERGFLMSTVGSGSYLGWVKCCAINGEWWERHECFS